MSSKVSFEGIGEVMATFYAENGVAAGQVVQLSGDSTVGPCEAGERFFGAAVSVKDGYVGVQVEGFAQVTCKDTSVTAGYVALTADGNGGVKKVSTASGSTDVGNEYLVVAIHGDETITIKL